jgi:hypothetical protein
MIICILHPVTIKAITSTKTRLTVHIAPKKEVNMHEQILDGKPEWNASLEGKRRGGWEDNIETNLKEIGCWLDSSGSE